MEYKGKLYGKLGHKYFDTSKTSEDWDNLEKQISELKKDIEKQRIEGILLGLAISKKAWDKGFGRNEIYENEILYQEELKKLS